MGSSGLLCSECAMLSCGLCVYKCVCLCKYVCTCFPKRHCPFYLFYGNSNLTHPVPTTQATKTHTQSKTSNNQQSFLSFFLPFSFFICTQRTSFLLFLLLLLLYLKVYPSASSPYTSNPAALPTPSSAATPSSPQPNPYS